MLRVLLQCRRRHRPPRASHRACTRPAHIGVACTHQHHPIPAHTVRWRGGAKPRMVTTHERMRCWNWHRTAAASARGEPGGEPCIPPLGSGGGGYGAGQLSPVQTAVAVTLLSRMRAPVSHGLCGSAAGPSTWARYRWRRRRRRIARHARPEKEAVRPERDLPAWRDERQSRERACLERHLSRLLLERASTHAVRSLLTCAALCGRGDTHRELTSPRTLLGRGHLTEREGAVPHPPRAFAHRPRRCDGPQAWCAHSQHASVECARARERP